MPYGRLDVFFPDGIIKSFLLNDDNISVGRSPGNTIALETDTISRYHMSLTRQNGETFITDLDSVNGTFLDGTRLETHSAKPLIGGEEILIGELILLYHTIDDNPTRPVDVPEEATQHIQSVEATYSVDVEAPEIAVSPGAHTASRVRVTNHSPQTERFIIEVTGVPKEWVRIDRPEIELRSGEDDEVMISFKPARRYDSVPGDYRVYVLARPRGQLENNVVAEVPLRVLPFSGIGIALESREIPPSGAFRVHIQNQGSAPLQLSVMGRDLAAVPRDGRVDGPLSFNIPNSRIVLQPGQRTTTGGTVSARRKRLFGSATRYPFDVLVRTSDASGYLIAQRAYFTQRPAMPGWGAVLLAVLGVGVVAVVAALLLILLAPPPVPQIRAFSADERVIRGTPVVMRWLVENASTLELRVDGTPVANLDPQSTGGVLDTRAYDGPLALSLFAGVSGASRSAAASVFVETPFEVASFTAQPQILVMNTRQTITLTWDVPGAISVRLTGADPATDGIDLPASGQQAFTRDILEPEAQVLLMASNAAGETIQATLAFQTVSAICLADGTVQIHAAPGETAQVIASAQPDEPLMIERRDASGDWLRVPLAGGATGWAQLESVTCAGNFSPDDLLVDAQAPVPPTATAPATRTPTPLPTTQTPPTATSSPTITPSPTRVFTRPPTVPRTSVPPVTPSPTFSG